MIRPCISLTEAREARLSKALLKTEDSCSWHDNVRLRGARAFILKSCGAMGSCQVINNGLFWKIYRKQAGAAGRFKTDPGLPARGSPE